MCPATFAPASRDVLIRDVFAGDTTPEALTTVEFTRTVAESLTRTIGSDVALLGQIPLDTRLREGSDSGTPVVIGDPTSPAAVALRGVAKGLAQRSRGLAGRSLGLSPSGR